MKPVSVQLSLYPLRQPHLGPAIAKALAALQARGLDVRAGPMSTVVVGDADAVFAALKASFESAAAIGDVVMVASISNGCPITAASPGPTP